MAFGSGFLLVLALAILGPMAGVALLLLILRAA